MVAGVQGVTVIPQSDHQRQLRGAESRIVGQGGINRPHIDRAMAGNGRGRERGKRAKERIAVLIFRSLSPRDPLFRDSTESIPGTL